MQILTLVKVCEFCNPLNPQSAFPFCDMCKFTKELLETQYKVDPGDLESIQRVIVEPCLGDGKGPPGCDGYSRKTTPCPECGGTGLRLRARKRLPEVFDTAMFREIINAGRVNLREKDPGYSFLELIHPSLRCTICKGHGIVRFPCTFCRGTLRRIDQYRILEFLGDPKKRGKKVRPYIPQSLAGFLAENEIYFTSKRFATY